MIKGLTFFCWMTLIFIHLSEEYELTSTIHKKVTLKKDPFLSFCDLTTEQMITWNLDLKVMPCLQICNEIGATCTAVSIENGNKCRFHEFTFTSSVTESNVSGPETTEIYVKPISHNVMPSPNLKDVALNKPVFGTVYTDYRSIESLVSGVACQEKNKFGCWCSESSSYMPEPVNNHIRIDFLGSYTVKEVILTISTINYEYFHDLTLHIGMSGDTSDQIFHTVKKEDYYAPGERVKFSINLNGRYMYVHSRRTYALCLCNIEIYV